MIFLMKINLAIVVPVYIISENALVAQIPPQLKPFNIYGELVVFEIDFGARNGNWTEVFWMRKKHDPSVFSEENGWFTAYRVYRGEEGTEKKILFEWKDLQFPVSDFKIMPP